MEPTAEAPRSVIVGADLEMVASDDAPRGLNRVVIRPRGRVEACLGTVGEIHGEPVEGLLVRWSVPIALGATTSLLAVASLAYPSEQALMLLAQGRSVAASLMAAWLSDRPRLVSFAPRHSLPASLRVVHARRREGSVGCCEGGPDPSTVCCQSASRPTDP
jgi:hypothetical protein